MKKYTVLEKETNLNGYKVVDFIRVNNMVGRVQNHYRKLYSGENSTNAITYYYKSHEYEIVTDNKIYNFSISNESIQQFIEIVGCWDDSVTILEWIYNNKENIKE